jgi:predicted transposase YbfD/YdcC
MDATDRLKDYLDWPGLKQVCRIRRKRIIRGQESTEVAYAITSLPRSRASAKTLLRLSRRHWGIENRLHYVRDVTLREDECRVRTGSAPQVLTAIRNTVLTLLRRLGYKNIVEGIEHFQENRSQALQLVRFGRIE